jgi:chromate transport protein ChrA
VSARRGRDRALQPARVLSVLRDAARVLWSPMSATEAPKPPPLSAILKVFLVIGLTAFGGGASAHIHNAVVHRKRWLDEKRFLEGMTVAHVVPGTNVSNLAAFVGAILGGYRGALVAVLAVVVPGLIAVLA